MTLTFETYLTIATSMVVLSLWKTYSGPAIAGLMAYSYPEMVIYNVVPAMLAAWIGWVVGPVFFQRISGKKVAGFNPKLRRFMKRWNHFGQPTMAFLAPVLVGIPSYTLISKRLKQSSLKTFSLLLCSILLWSGASYFGFLLLELGQYVTLDSLLPGFFQKGF